MAGRRTGRGAAKNELVGCLEKHSPRASRAQLMALEPINHPTDGELLAHGREVVKAGDRILLREA